MREAPQASRTSHIVFTPPRDDFGLGPPVVDQNDKAVADRPNPFVATHQAICLTVRAIFFLLLLMVVMGVAYYASNLLVHKHVVLECSSQSLLYGYISPGQEGSTAIPHCNEGYELIEPVSSLACRLFREKCIITKKATVLREAVEKCERDYAFVSEDLAKEALLNGSYTVEQVSSQAMYDNPAACHLSYANATTASTLYESTGQSVIHASNGIDFINIGAVVFVVLAIVVAFVSIHSERSRQLPKANSSYVKRDARDENECRPLLEVEAAEAS